MVRYNFAVSDERHINGTTFFSTKVAANRLGITPAQVRKQCQDGTLNAQKIGKAWFVELPASTSTPKSKRISKRVAVKTSPMPSVQTPSPAARLANTIASVLPAKPVAQLPVAYVKSLPMVIGVVVSIALFFVGTLPFMSQSIASFSGIGRPMQEMQQTVGKGYEHFVRKTDELLEYSSLSMALGVGALSDTIAARVPDIQAVPDQRPKTARMSSLGRSYANTPRVSVRVPIATEVYNMAAAAAALYQFERIAKTPAPLAGGSTWGCVLGVSVCEDAQPVSEPVSGVSVYDEATQMVHCIQVLDGQVVNTPGRCEVENR